MPGPARTFGPAQRQAAALQTNTQPVQSTTQPGASGNRNDTTRGGTLGEYYGGYNPITGKRFGATRSMPTDPAARARIEQYRRQVYSQLWGGGR